MTRERVNAMKSHLTPKNPFKRADMRKLPKRIALAGAVTAACMAMGLAAAQETAVRGRMLDHAAADPRAVDIDGTRHLPRSGERELPKATFVLGDAREPAPTTPATVAAPAAPAATERSETETPQFASGSDLLASADRALSRIRAASWLVTSATRNRKMTVATSSGLLTWKVWSGAVK